jgi:sigma-E factor negative regulatory protein RseB
MLGACVGCLSISAYAAGSSANEARHWLLRMEQALDTRNYDGRYIHSTDAQSESLRIVHRFENGKVKERLVNLDGSGRESVRTDNEVTTYIPDKRSVVVEVRPDADPLLKMIPEFKSELEAYYDIATGPMTQILERRAQMVIVQPRDDYRYGYRLWLDAETAMPLKSQLLDRSGRIVEQVAFAELTEPAKVTEADLTPKVDASRYQWIRYEVKRRSIPVDSVGWRVENLPPGFKLTVTRIRPMVGSSFNARHLVYSDGLATVSMFIEQDGNDGTEVPAGLQRVGSSHAYQQEKAGYTVTAVGEVPAITVKSMVMSLQQQPVVAAEK